LANEIRNGKIDVRDKTIVIVCTGHGLKDPDVATANMPIPTNIEVDVKELERILLDSTK
jgi:threonine synthase